MKNVTDINYYIKYVTVAEYIDGSNYKEYIGKTVKVIGNVNLSDLGLKFIPIDFTEVGGDFDCSYNEIQTLFGSPKTVGGSFWCSINNLVNLEYSPMEIGGGFYCAFNMLSSLRGMPKKINGDLICQYNNLMDLSGAPEEVGGNMDCSNNELSLLLGGPIKVYGNFFCVDNKLVSLYGAPNFVGGSFGCQRNMLRTLEHSPRIVCGNYYFAYNELVSLKGLPTEVFGKYHTLPDSIITPTIIKFLESLHECYKMYDFNAKTLFRIFGGIFEKNIEVLQLDPSKANELLIIKELIYSVYLTNEAINHE